MKKLFFRISLKVWHFICILIGQLRTTTLNCFKEGVMKKSLKIALLLVIFFLMISSFAFASFKVNATPITECTALMLHGIGMIGLGSFLREAVKR